MLTIEITYLLITFNGFYLIFKSLTYYTIKTSLLTKNYMGLYFEKSFSYFWCHFKQKYLLKIKIVSIEHTQNKHVEYYMNTKLRFVPCTLSLHTMNLFSAEAPA